MEKAAVPEYSGLFVSVQYVFPAMLVPERPPPSSAGSGGAGSEWHDAKESFAYVPNVGYLSRAIDGQCRWIRLGEQPNSITAPIVG